MTTRDPAVRPRTAMTNNNGTGNAMSDPTRALRVVPGDEPTRPATSWTAQQLMATEFPPPRWAVPGIMCEGVNLLCGPPKVGKSWASLGLALAVAAGSRAFGSIPVQAGPVLYLALEDTGRRLQSRMGKLLAGAPAPPDLLLATACPPIDRGGAEHISGWLEHHPDARMVVIDVFAKIRGTATPGASAYEADYSAVTAIKRIADSYSVPFVLVHHIRKAGSEDFLTEVSGTNGIAGAADATLVLKRARGQADGVLHVTGRDVDESEYALSFQPECGMWTLLDGSPAEHQTTDTRAAILRHLRAHPDSGPRAIAAGTGLGEPNVKATCRRMLTEGLLACNAKGHYRLPDQGSIPDVSGVSHVSLSP